MIPYDNASISITGVSSDWSVVCIVHQFIVLLSINDLLIIELINYNRPTGVDDREIYVSVDHSTDQHNTFHWIKMGV